MKTIRNLTIKPIKVSLGGGKVLRLGPRADGVVRDDAAARPAVVKLVEAGTVEILGGSSAGHGPQGGRS